MGSWDPPAQHTPTDELPGPIPCPVPRPARWRRRLGPIPMRAVLAAFAAAGLLGMLATIGDDAPQAPTAEPDPGSPSSRPAASDAVPTTTTQATMLPTAPNGTLAPSVTEGTVAGVDGTARAVAALLEGLVVADVPASLPPYERSEYDRNGWGDVDGDCISTRHEVLTSLSLEPVVMDATGCFVESGRWLDPYTGLEYTAADQVTIDHVVPLAEAHRSGAWQWDLDSRYRFANDEHPGQLRVVGADVNQSKSDRRPDDWLPPAAQAHCQYAADWITTKARYALTVVEPERAALAAALATCDANEPAEPAADAPLPLVVITAPTTTTTTAMPTSTGPGTLTLLSCRRREETVTIGNSGGEPISLSGFVVSDEGDKHSVSLDRFGSLEPGRQLVLRSGPDATDGPGEAAWTNENVWNNDGDTASLIAPDGTRQSTPC